MNVNRYWKLGALATGVVTLALFQNCDRPYKLGLENPTIQSSVLSPPLLVDDGATISNNPNFKLKLSQPYAQEVSISFNPDCQGTWVPFQKEIDVTWDGGDGDVEFFVKFRNFRKEETDCISAKVLLDTTAPQLELTEKANSITKEKSADFVVDIEENVSGVDEIKCRLLKGSEAVSGTSNLAFQKCTSSLHFDNLTDNSYRLEFSVSDIAGNASELLTYKWVVDSKAPALNLRKAPARYINVQPVVYEFDSVGGDNVGGGIAGYYCSVGNSALTLCTSPYSLSGLANGTYLVTIEAHAVTGSISRIQNTFTLDTVNPVINITAHPPSLSKSTSAQFNFTASDNAGGSGLKQALCIVDGGAESPCANMTGMLIKNLANGAHSFKVTAVDLAGNRSTTASFSWSVDATKPLLNINTASLPASITKIRYGTIKYNVTDTQSGLDSVSCQLDDIVTESCSKTQRTFSGLADGVHKFTLTAKDNAGNTATYSYSWRVDTTAPVVDITKPLSGPTTAKSIEVIFTATDTGGSGFASIYCRLDSAPAPGNSCSGRKITYWVPDKGTHKVVVTATDKAGNVKTDSVSWTLE
jgi:hypothetical protein